MDEREWRERENPAQLLEFIGKQQGVSGRKLLLFAAACCRRIWPMFTDARSRQAVNLLESWLDGGGNLDLACQLAYAAFTESQGYGKWAPWEALRPGRPNVRARAASIWAARAVAATVSREGINGDQKTFAAERCQQCTPLRDIFGNPFRPVTLAAALRTPAVLALAQAAYENRIMPAGTLEPERLAILADALEEAGCTDADILAHLRGPGPHFRGCHIIDAILDKK